MRSAAHGCCKTAIKEFVRHLIRVCKLHLSTRSHTPPIWPSCAISSERHLVRIAADEKPFDCGSSWHQQPNFFHKASPEYVKDAPDS